MAEREILLSPTDTGDAVALSPKLYRKRILPKATINYKGRKITFDDAYLNDLANNFNDRAYDQVPFLLADKENSHTMDPERFRGEVKRVEVTADGLYGVIEVTAEGAKVLQNNPKLGVSARILEGYARSDGKTFPRALNHVLGTLDPRIPGLGAWEEVALSNSETDNAVTFDLSATSYEELESMATREEQIAIVAEATGISVADVEALNLSDEVLADYANTFLAAVDETSEEVADEAEVEVEVEVEAATAEETAVEKEETPADAFSELSDEELAALVAELEAELAAEEAADETVGEESEAEAAEEAEEAVAEETVEEPELVAALSNDVEDAVEENAELEELSDADYATLMSEGKFGNGLGDDTNAETEIDDSDLTDAEIAAFLDEPFAAWKPETADTSDAEVEDLEPVTLSNEDEEYAKTATQPVAALVAPAEVTLSNTELTALDLANRRIAELEKATNSVRFESEKKDYIRKGVPAHLLDLARPVLTASGSAVELSNGTETVDAAAVLRQVLDQVSGYIDLATERGHSFPLSEADPVAMEAEEDKRLARLWAEQTNS